MVTTNAFQRVFAWLALDNQYHIVKYEQRPWRRCLCRVTALHIGPRLQLPAHTQLKEHKALSYTHLIDDGLAHVVARRDGHVLRQALDLTKRVC